MTIAILACVILLFALLAIRAGGCFLLAARFFSKLAAASIAAAHCCALLDDLISCVFREGRKLYRSNRRACLTYVLGE